jgi:hypothetical protein
MSDLGLTQNMDFTICRSFFALWGKKDLQKKKSTMLPQAIAAFA